MDLDDFIAARRAHMASTEPAWSPAKVEAMALAAQATQVRRHRRRVAGVAVVAVAAVGLLALAPRLLRESHVAAPGIASLTEAAGSAEERPAEPAVEADQVEIIVAWAEPLSEDASVQPHSEDNDSRWRLDRGKARFIAEEGVVDVGDAEVKFVGAVVVERTQAGYVVVAEEGDVTVVRRGTVHRVEEGAATNWTDEGQNKLRTPSRSGATPSDVAVGDWRTLALVGKAALACDALTDARTPSDVDGLMLAADTCRKARRPRAAVPFLERVVDKHAASAMAPLAAFTLGRLYKEKLRAPSSAARLFAKARTLDPDGPLADNAWAKEAEAWAAAGRAEKAKARAAAYLHAFPSGRHRKAMQTLAL